MVEQTELQKDLSEQQWYYAGHSDHWAPRTDSAFRWEDFVLKHGQSFTAKTGTEYDSMQSGEMKPIATSIAESRGRFFNFELKFCKISGGLAVIGVFVVNSHGFGWRTTTMEGQTMPGIVEFPQLVQRAVEGFGDLFYGGAVAPFGRKARLFECLAAFEDSVVAKVTP